MATNVKLRAKPRTERGTNAMRKLRAAGEVPGVVYGHGEATRALVVDAHELDRLLSHHRLENTIIELDVAGEATPVRVLVREVQRHAYRAAVLHIDFYQIHAGERITLSVPVRMVGTAPGVREGGILQQVLNEVEVRCLPDAIPESIELDVSALSIGDSAHASDLRLPPGVELLEDAKQTICTLQPPRVEAVEGEAGAAPEARAEPEVIGRGREESQDEGD
jgi:large subunit ribosomal protein L25